MTPPWPVRSQVLLAAAFLAVAGSASSRAVQTIHLLALRVEFPKEDPDDFTTGGNGLFDRRTPEEALAATGGAAFRYPYDVPPHDGHFLEHHRTALQNYVRVASQGQLELTWEIFPTNPNDAYVAPDRLASYGSGASEAEVTRNWVRFLRDALSVSAPDVGNLGRFQSFLIFNASVSVQGDISAELPPLVLTEREISRSGLPIPSEVKTAWFMPQQIQQPGGVIGLNGAFAKTFLASLGLPVLSNTRTGGSAVGGWTLMDVGSDNLIERRSPDGSDTTLGFVPCLPMAWEQMRLGWLEPAVVRRDTTILLAGLAARNTTLPRAIKVPITADEYFLLELRHSTFASEKKHPEIQYSAEDARGVWLRPVDEDYDAYTPGSGVLVWHIDEERVRLWEPTNDINAHPERPAMFILEADGYRDIGITNALGHPRSSEGIGSRDDPFPITGEKQVYPDGEWGPGHPVSLANDLTHTGIEMTFARVGNARDTVAVTVRWKESGGRPARFSRYIGGPVAVGVAVHGTMIVVATTNGNVWAFDDTLGGVGPNDGFVAQFPETVTRKPIIQDDGAILVVGRTTARRYRYSSGAWDRGTLEPAPPPVPSALTADLDRDGSPYTITWTDDGSITASQDGQVRWTVALGDSLVGPPAIGDVDRDKYGDVIAAARRSVHVWSRNGLPVITYGLGRADSADVFTGPPVTARGVVYVPGRRALYQFDGLTNRYPFARHLTPAPISGSAAVDKFTSSPLPVAVWGTDEGWLYRFGIPEGGAAYPIWPQLYGNAASSNTLDLALLGIPEPPPSDLMPPSRTYFYPSPVGNTEGKLRFYLSARADVAVRIYTSVGELVWETSLDAAQADNEITWPGGTKFASGLYLCRIVATSADGRTSAATIPVGVAR